MEMLFHHPTSLTAEGRSGSSVRPRLMAQAFAANGYEVTEVVGGAAERARAMAQLVRDLDKGRQVDFIYSESHTLPMPLTESHHLPLRPFLDYRFFSELRRRGIPVGLFYRDAHWRFPELTPSLHPAKRLFVNSFHHLEWRQLSRHVDHLFLPLTQMLTALPESWESGRVSSLPPGLVPRERKTTALPDGIFRLLYVGGVAPPLYDLTPLFEAARLSERLSVTISCRPEEWARLAGHYDVPREVQVVHAVGSELDPLYENADAVAILWRPHPYLNLTLPVKLFEAMSHGLPIITTEGTATATFVEAEGVGWTVTTTEDVGRLTNRLLQRPDELLAAYHRVDQVRDRHTWRARADQVVRTLAAVPR